MCSVPGPWSSGRNETHSCVK